MSTHIDADGEFQSDKYPTTPPGKVPLSVKDATAQDLLWEYAQRRRPVDAEFSEDLEGALRAKGYVPGKIPSVVLEGVPVSKIEELLELYGSRNVRILTDGRVEVDVAEPPAIAPERAAKDGRKAHYGDGAQPWDAIVAAGWGPAFAASNVTKYLRRTKSLEHSLESAAWYYARLYEGAANEAEVETELEAPWGAALARLEAILSNEEIVRVRGAL